MLFSTPVFFVFFIVYFALHLIIPAKHRIWLIIAGSTFFYSYWNPVFIGIPFFLTLMSYLGGLWIAGAMDQKSRRIHLYFTIIGLLTPLLIFKYTNFFYTDFVGHFFSLQGKLIDLPLPLGISFITFTAISYVTDVYFKRFKAESNFATMCGYVLFFPQLIAGPILRPNELIPQLHRQRRAQKKRLIIGFVIFTIGLVKKLVIADQLADWIDPVFASDQTWSAGEYIVAIYGFSIQIYCDFSGYTDMALGLAMILGVRLPINFNRPYSALSIVEFWRCWHITLSSWLKDYLYIALGGNRVAFQRQISNILVTMILGGLWHGASWTFAIWGAIHGLAICLVHIFRRYELADRLYQLPKNLRVFITFHIVTFAWIFFRAQDLDTAWRVLSGPFRTIGVSEAASQVHIYPLILIFIVLVLHRYDTHRHIRYSIQRMPPAIMWAGIFGLWVLSMTISAGSSSDFVYFDF